MATIRVDVVSAEQSIFSGEAKFVALPGESGELGILHHQDGIAKNHSRQEWLRRRQNLRP